MQLLHRFIYMYGLYIWNECDIFHTFQYYFRRLNIKIQDTSLGHIDLWGEWSYTIRNVFREAMGWYHGSIIYNFSFRFPVWYISQSLELWSTLKMWVELNDCQVGDISIFYFLVLAISFCWRHYPYRSYCSNIDIKRNILYKNQTKKLFSKSR